MKRFLVFYGDNYYPSGGWDDFRGDYDSMQKAERVVRQMGHADWLQIVDTESGSVRKFYSRVLKDGAQPDGPEEYSDSRHVPFCVKQTSLNRYEVREIVRRHG